MEGFSSKHTELKVALLWTGKHIVCRCVCTFHPGTFTGLGSEGVKCVCIFNDYGSKKLGGCSLVLVLIHSFILAGKPCNAVACVFWGTHLENGDSSVLERQTHDWKVAGSNPCRSSRKNFFSRVNFLCWLLFRYHFHSCVTAVAHKRSQSFCQKCRWQVTAKHTCTLHMRLCMKWHGAWLYGVLRTCAETAAVSRGTSHVSAVSTPLRWIFRNAL